MKVRRAKHSQRVMTFYKYKFNFLPPYNVLLDGTFCQAALKNRVSIKEQIENYFPDPVNFLTTKCVIKELGKIGAPVSSALKVIEQFNVTHCPHTPARSAIDCLLHLARRSKDEGKMKFLIATQDFTLIEKLRECGGIPILTLKHKAVYLENPSEQSVAEKSGDVEIEKAKELKTAILGEQKEVVFKKKKVKGKNPLSCLKKKKIGTIQKKPDEQKKTRRKKKKKVSEGAVEVTSSLDN